MATAPTAERIQREIHIPDRLDLIPAEIDVLPVNERRAGTIVTGRILWAANIGYRDGDHIQGVITNQISENVMMATNWQGLTFMGVVSIVDCARLNIQTPYGNCTFRIEDFSLIEISHRRGAKGKKFAPVLSKEEHIARQAERTRKYHATMQRKRQQEADRLLSDPHFA